MGEGGLLSSPNYPEAYPSPSRCAWLLEAPAGHTITVRLRPLFKRSAAHDKPSTSLASSADDPQVPDDHVTPWSLGSTGCRWLEKPLLVCPPMIMSICCS